MTGVDRHQRRILNGVRATNTSYDKETGREGGSVIAARHDGSERSLNSLGGGKKSLGKTREWKKGVTDDREAPHQTHELQRPRHYKTAVTQTTNLDGTNDDIGAVGVDEQAAVC